MTRRTLNDRALKALKPAPKGKSYDVMDALVPGLGVRVLDSGRRTFVLVARFPGSPRNPKTSLPNPTRRALGEYGVLTLESARTKARDWLEMIRRGVDPREDEERQQIAEQRKRGNSFRAVVEDFVRLAVIGPDPAKPRQRKGNEIKRDLEREFVARWDGRPITEITPHDVTAVIDEVVSRGSLYQAHNLFGHVRRLFNWAIARGVYGLDRSPCDRMRPKEVIGPKAVRTRVLSDTELRALWRAAEAMPYPYGPLFRMLTLTGQRKSEVADAQWGEFDLNRQLWTISAERMKADAPHVVPLTDDVIAILHALPRFSGGDYLFSSSLGASPVNGFSKAKTVLDRAMLEQLQRTGDSKAAVKLKPFVIHDIRRTVRTNLSALPVSSDVAELVIAHARPGLRRVYDQYAFESEKRQALELWASRLRSIVDPAQANVIPFAKAEP